MGRRIFLFLVVFIAFLLRFVNLGSLPPSLSWDEAAWGYNAYSIGIDGRDEFGKFLPVNYLESFGDFKPPVYAYLDVIPVKFFGLNEFSTRFPSAFLGTLTVILTYLLTKEIFPKKENLAVFTALILAISPWHILLSRAAFEANVATFFIVLGVWLFLLSLRRNKFILFLSLLSFIFSVQTFNTARVVSPILTIILTFAFRKELLKDFKQTFLVYFLSLLILLPIIPFFLSPQASLRFREVNIFSDISTIQETNEEMARDGNTWWSRALHNRRLSFSVDFLKHYFDNLSPAFLFVKGDGNPKFSVQEVGQMYLWDIPFFIFGILFLFRKKEGHWWLVPVWLLIGIIPAATARETPHALRIEASLPTFQILVAYGFVNFYQGIKKYKYLILYGLCFVLLINVLYFLHEYFVHYKNEYSGEWQYGYKDSINYVSTVYNKYQRIFVSRDLGRPYIYYLFYRKIDPSEFRKTAVVEREALGFVHIKAFDKFFFDRNINFGKDINKLGAKNSLYINTPSEIPKDATVLKTFYLLNGKPVLKAYTL